MATNSLAPSATLPSYLQSNSWAAPQSYLNQLPGMFNTSGLKSSYANQEAQNYSQGSALAAAAANQYVQRARQSGASVLGAGFAQASAMLPVYQQNAQMNTQLQQQLLQNRANQAQIGAGLSGDIGRLQGQQQGTLADYLTTQQKLAQSQSQFGQTFGLQQQQLGLQRQQDTAQNSLYALMLAQRQPKASGDYYTDNMGRPMSATDAASMKRLQGAQGFTGAIQGGLQNFF